MSRNRPRGQPYHCSLPKYILAESTVDGSLAEMKTYWVDVENDDYLKKPEAFTEEGSVYPYGYPTVFPQKYEVARVPQSVRIGGPAPGVSRGHLYFLATAQAVRDACQTQFKTRPYFAYNPSCTAFFPWWPALVGNYPSAGQPGVVIGADPTYTSADGVCATHGPVGAGACVDANNIVVTPTGEVTEWRIQSQVPGGPPTQSPIDPPFFAETCFLASDALNFIIGGYAEHTWGEFTTPMDPEDPSPGDLTGPNTAGTWPYFLQWTKDQYPFFHRYRTIVIKHANPEWLGNTSDGADPDAPAVQINVQRLIARSKRVIDAIFQQELGFEKPPGFELSAESNGNSIAYYLQTVRDHFGIAK